MVEPHNEKAVRVHNLVKVFGKFRAIDDISFDVAEGEIFGFLGPNGAGKTTTIKVLCGLLRPSSGQAWVAGLNVSTHYEEIRKHIGYMSQKFSLYEDLTVQENLDFYGGIYGLPPEKELDRHTWVLEMAGLAGKGSMITADLAIGWKQRLALGCAVLHEPPILFLDEPTSGVDPMSRRAFWELIHDMARRGVTVFVTTHYMEEAEYCHRLALMGAGRIIAVGTPGELKHTWMRDTVLELECDELSRALEILEEEETLTEVAVFGRLLHLVAPDPDLAVGRVRERLTAAGLPISRLEPVSPSLEDVFVTLTKKGQGAAQ